MFGQILVKSPKDKVYEISLAILKLHSDQLADRQTDRHRRIFQYRIFDELQKMLCMFIPMTPIS